MMLDEGKMERSWLFRSILQPFVGLMLDAIDKILDGGLDHTVAKADMLRSLGGSDDE